MKKYICKEVQTENGGYFEIEKELIQCEDCASCRKSYFESVTGMVCNKTRHIVEPYDYCSMAKPKETE